MPALIWLGVAFVAGNVTGGYVMSSTSKLFTLGALGAGAYYLVKRG
ncbi:MULTISPECIES: hypothetical protein [unclassified Halobacteriovorax]